jgi:hypothetical protein
MNDVGRVFVGVVAIMLFVFVAMFCYTQKHESQKTQMQTWATDHGYTMVEEPVKPWFNVGSPFWFTDDDDDVYKVVLADRDHQKKTSWFRFRAFWGMDQAWKD